MKRVTVLVNTLNNVNSFVYSNHIAFWCYTKKIFPDVDFKFFTPPRMSIDMARNTAAKIALETDSDYLLFIDDDVLIQPYTLPVLLSAKADITAALVIIRGYPFNVMAFKRDEKGNLPYFNDLPTVDIEIEPAINPDGNGLGRDAIIKKVLKDPVTQEDGLAAVGFSCCLIRCDLLKKVKPPYFITGPRNTEDIYFCLKAKDTIDQLRFNNLDEPELKIAMVTSLQPGHFLHPEPIEWATIDIFKSFYEDLYPDHVKQLATDQDRRDENYIVKNLKGL